MILNNLEDLIKCLGRAIMSATTFEFIAPYVEMAQQNMIERAIGTEFTEHLDALVNAGDDLSDDDQLLISKVHRALAWSAYLLYLPFSIGNDGDNGLQEIGTDNTSPVRIGVLDKRIRESEKNSVMALESLLQFLETNPDKYPVYQEAAETKTRRSLFLSSATMMSGYLPIVSNNFRLFLNVTPYIRIAETDYFLPRLGAEQYARLKAGLAADDLTDAENTLLATVRRALAHTAYWLALPSMQFVLLENGNLRILSDFDGIYNRKAPDQETILSMVRSAETEAKKWQNALGAYLSGHIDEFPLYAASKAAKAAPANKLPDNDKYQHIFRMK